MKKYILEGRTPVLCDDIMKWGAQFEDIKSRRVAETTIGDARISTVFLGLDHNWGGGPPLLFETMIFGGEHDGYCERYSTWDEAERGHAAALALVGGVH